MSLALTSRYDSTLIMKAVGQILRPTPGLIRENPGRKKRRPILPTL